MCPLNNLKPCGLPLRFCTSTVAPFVLCHVIEFYQHIWECYRDSLCPHILDFEYIEIRRRGSCKVYRWSHIAYRKLNLLHDATVISHVTICAGNPIQFSCTCIHKGLCGQLCRRSPVYVTIAWTKMRHTKGLVQFQNQSLRIHHLEMWDVCICPD